MSTIRNVNLQNIGVEVHKDGRVLVWLDEKCWKLDKNISLPTVTDLHEIMQNEFEEVPNEDGASYIW